MPDVGRPSIYSDQLATTICHRLSTGESLRSICRDESMPHISSVMLWVIDGKHPDFSEQYAKARELQAHYWADEIVDISDDGSNDYMIRAAKNGETEEALNPEAIARSRLRVDTRKWMLSKMLPKFADKQQEKESIDLAAALMALADKLPS